MWIEITVAAALISGQAQSAPVMLEAFGPADIQAIVESTGGRLGETATGPDGFSVQFWSATGLDTVFDAMTCEGEGKAMTCREYSISTAFRAADAGAADRAVDDLATVWLITHAEGSTVIVSRMGFTYGGVGREHLAATLQTFDDLASRGRAIEAE